MTWEAEPGANEVHEADGPGGVTGGVTGGVNGDVNGGVGGAQSSPTAPSPGSGAEPGDGGDARRDVPADSPVEAPAGSPVEAPVDSPDAWIDAPTDVPGDGSAGSPLEAAAPDLAADLVTAQAAVAALTNDLQRLQAEFLNYKRRVDRDRELVKQNATFSVLSAMLPVLDDLDRAREHGELEGGFKAVADSLEGLVAAHGLVKFGNPGDEFDPRFHEALMHSHSPDVTTTTCQNIVSAGYQMGERVVRPARVTVVDPEPAASAPSAETVEGESAPRSDDTSST